MKLWARTPTVLTPSVRQPGQGHKSWRLLPHIPTAAGPRSKESASCHVAHHIESLSRLARSRNAAVPLQASRTPIRGSQGSSLDSVEAPRWACSSESSQASQVGRERKKRASPQAACRQAVQGQDRAGESHANIEIIKSRGAAEQMDALPLRRRQPTTGRAGGSHRPQTAPLASAVDTCMRCTCPVSAIQAQAHRPPSVLSPDEGTHRGIKGNNHGSLCGIWQP